MNKKLVTGKLSLEKLKITKLTGSKSIVGGAITIIGPAQTINQGPTKKDCEDNNI